LGSAATPIPGIEVRRGEQSGHFDRREKVDWSPQIAFAWHSEHALRQGAVLWCVQGHVAEKGMDRGEADVATAGAIVAVLFEMIEEYAEERGVQIGQRKRRGRLAQMSLRILQQQTKGIAVAREGMGTHLSLSHEPVHEESLKQS
jgi:hypothetical protein